MPRINLTGNYPDFPDLNFPGLPQRIVKDIEDMLDRDLRVEINVVQTLATNNDWGIAKFDKSDGVVTAARIKIRECDAEEFVLSHELSHVMLSVMGYSRMTYRPGGSNFRSNLANWFGVYGEHKIIALNLQNEGMDTVGPAARLAGGAISRISGAIDSYTPELDLMNSLTLIRLIDESPEWENDLKSSFFRSSPGIRRFYDEFTSNWRYGEPSLYKNAPNAYSTYFDILNCLTSVVERIGEEAINGGFDLRSGIFFSPSFVSASKWDLPSSEFLKLKALPSEKPGHTDILINYHPTRDSGFYVCIYPQTVINASADSETERIRREWLTLKLGESFKAMERYVGNVPGSCFVRA
jgi:hypothetical protein